MTGEYDEWGNWFLYAAPLNIDVEGVRNWALENDVRNQNNKPHEFNVQTYDIFLLNSESPSGK